MEDNEQLTKACTTCKQVLPATPEYFSKKKRCKDGLSYTCKACCSAYYFSNKERHRAVCKAWTMRNREKVNADARAWCAKNIEKERERWRKQREGDPQRQRDATMRSYYKHQEKRQASRRRYRELHLEEERAKDREFKRNDLVRGRERTQRRRALKRQTQTEKVDYKAIAERDGGVCHICGWFVDPKDVAFDHIIPLAKGGTHTADNIAVAHYSCNLSKNARIVPSKAPPPIKKSA